VVRVEGKYEGGGVATKVKFFLKLGFDKGDGPGGGGGVVLTHVH